MFITGNECKKRWKYIRDSYNRCKRKNKLPTGSSASSKTTKWMLFERLHFLDNIPSERPSISTVHDENVEGETYEETGTAGTDGSRRCSERGTINEGTRGAGIDTADTSELRNSEERSGTSEAGLGTAGT